MANQFIIHGLSEEGKAYRTALVAIQELHKPRFIGTESDGTPIYACMHCIREKGTCKTRRLADEGLDRMARTNQGEER